MPSRNVLKTDIAESYYHVYGRGVSRGEIYKDEEDYRVFLNLLARYLSNEPSKDKTGREYPSYYSEVELLCFCLMPNHFHLMFYQQNERAISKLMQSVLTSYSGYFNRKYGRSGPILESRYKSSRISNDVYLQHISRYIHLNPAHWKKWEWSSRDYYVGRHEASWIRPKRVLDLFDDDPKRYEEFVEDYIDRRDELKALVEHETAD